MPPAAWLLIHHQPMKVRVTQDIAINGEHIPKGTVLDVDQQMAGNLFSAGRAELAAEEPDPADLPPTEEPAPAEPAGKSKKEK